MRSLRPALMVAAMICLALLLTGCSSSYEPVEESATSSSSAQPSQTRSYTQPRTFNGYRCTDDCSGHDAGYEWAEENDVVDPDDCGGNSNSFIEGCEAYAEEIQEEYERQEQEYEDYDAGYPDPYY